MTNEEQQQSQARFRQILQNEIDTSDINKWQNQRRTDGLPYDWQSWKDARERALSELKTSAEYSARKHRADIDAKRIAEAEESERLALEPEKRRLKNEWLANHPDKTPKDFEEKAWQPLRENLIEQRENDALEAEMQAAKTSGIYGL